MEIQGQFKSLRPVIERGDFKSRKVWLTTAENPQYPQTIELEVSGKSIDIFDNIAEGAPVTCSVNLRGREWADPQGVTKVFNTLQCWKVTANGVATQQVPALNASLPGNTELPDTGGLPF